MFFFAFVLLTLMGGPGPPQPPTQFKHWSLFTFPVSYFCIFLTLCLWQGQARRRKNMPEFLGDSSTPHQDSVSQLSGSIPGSITGTDRWRNRAAIRFSGLFSSNSGNGSLGKVSIRGLFFDMCKALSCMQNKHLHILGMSFSFHTWVSV